MTMGDRFRALAAAAVVLSAAASVRTARADDRSGPHFRHGTLGEILDENYDYDGPPAVREQPYRATTHRIRLHKEIPYTGQVPLPDGFELERTWTSYLVVPSAFVLGTSYLLSLGAAAASGFRQPNAALVVPIFGPFVAASSRYPTFGDFLLGRSSLSGLSGDEAVIRTALLVDGVAQALSAVSLVMGVIHPRYTLVREVPSVHVTPIPLAGGYGFAVRAVY